MKTIVAGGLLLATLAAAAYVLSPIAAAQRGDRTPAPFGGDVLRLEGPGSSIGVTVRDQTGDAPGVVIESVREGTPATRAGLRKGDVVVEFDGERTRSAQQFTRLVRETAPGRSVKMTIARDGSRQTLDITPETRDSITLQQFPNITADVFRGWPWGEGSLGTRRRMGVAVLPLSDQLATYFGVKEGVLVSEVTNGTPAASAGIQAGDIITAVNGRSVMSSADLVREVREADAGSTIEVRLTRNHKDQTVKVTLPQRRQAPAAGSLPI
jgi:serine protease Do